MREQKRTWLGQTRDAHRVIEFQMFRCRLITPERALEYQEICFARERGEFFRIAGVGTVDDGRSIVVSETYGEALARVRRRECLRPQSPAIVAASRNPRRQLRPHATQLGKAARTIRNRSNRRSLA